MTNLKRTITRVLMFAYLLNGRGDWSDVRNAWGNTRRDWVPWAGWDIWCERLGERSWVRHGYCWGSEEGAMPRTLWHWVTHL